MAACLRCSARAPLQTTQLAHERCLDQLSTLCAPRVARLSLLRPPLAPGRCAVSPMDYFRRSLDRFGQAAAEPTQRKIRYFQQHANSADLACHSAARPYMRERR